MTLLEVVATMAVIAIMGTSLILGLLTARRAVASARVINNARVVLQRNIDQALSVPFISNVTPRAAVLVVTGTEGSAYNDEGTGNGATSVPILEAGSGVVLAQGTLTRTVTAETPPAVSSLSDVSTVKIVRVTFKLDYNYLGRPYTYSLSTLRAQDDQ